MNMENDTSDTGILLVDKPVGWTSHDVVDCVRKRFGIRKVGHCGTLDPNATGLLVLLLGRATKLSASLSNQDKTYRGSMKLGQTTTTQDAEGDISSEQETEHISQQDIQEALQAFTGEIEQIPPMASAKKKKGKRLYKLAHQGKSVEREPKQTTVYRLELLDTNMPFVDFEIDCAKGTYVRTLCADIGDHLGSGAFLYSLRRLKSGNFHVDDAYSMETIKTWEREELLQSKIGLSELPAYTT